MASLNFKNNAFSTISVLAQGATTLTVTDASKFPTLVPFILTLWDSSTYDEVNDDPNMEVVVVTEIVGADFTITRGEEGTNDVAHAGGQLADMLWTAGSMNDAVYGIVTKLDEAVDVTASQIATLINASAEVFNDANIAASIARDSELHNESHTVASHSDTTATGAELETLTDGSDADALHAHGANDTHRTSDGSDHTFIDQSVIIGASPTFDGVNITNIDADTLIADVKEANVSAVTKGQMCAIVGSSGNKFEVQLCDCDNASLIRALGFVVADTAQNGVGQVVHKGLLTNVDTQIGNTDVNPNGETWAAGDMLFVSNTPGGLTNVRPSVGRCIKAGRTLKGNSASDTLLAIVHTNDISACAAAGEDLCNRMGDNDGVNKCTFKDYANNEVAAFDSNGNLTLVGNVDGRDVSVDGTKLDTIETDAAADQNAGEVSITDAGSIITAANVEDALQENRTAINLNTAKETNVSTELSEGTNTETTVDVNSSDGSNATLLSASTLRAGLLTKAKFDEIVANTLKDTNVSTDLSEGSNTETTVDVNSSDGTNATLIAASTLRAGLLTKAKFDEIVANNAKVTNVTTNLSEGTNTETTVDVNSSDGTNATLVAASTSRAGLLTKAKFDEIVANNAKVTNATHTGEVTGSGALTVDKTAITGKGAVTAVETDYVLISDTGDSGNLKKALVSDFGSAPSDVIYGSTWDGNTDAATKNAIYDEIQLMAARHHKGYVMGGYTTGYVDIIEDLIYLTETSQTIIAVMSEAKSDNTGVSSPHKGYSMGGYPSGYSAVIEGLVYSVETCAAITATLDTAKRSGAGVNGYLKGYLMGGHTGSDITVIEDITFSTEASVVISATLDNAIRENVGVSSATKGYSMGGYLVTTIEDITFSTEASVAISATLDTAKSLCAPCNSTTKGYIMGGYINPYTNVIEDLIFSSETSQAITATLDNIVGREAGVSSTIKGYCAGGNGPSAVIEDLIFATETSQAITATLDTAKYGGTGVSYGAL